MKVRKVNRYTCEFCGKSNCSASHISRHEERCTLNPKRICGFCKLLEQEQPDIAAIIASLPSESEYKKTDAFDDNYNSDYLNKTVLPMLREKTGNCPACILAAIRLAKIPGPAVSDFDFKKERQSIWNDVNEANRPDYSNICLGHFGDFGE